MKKPPKDARCDFVLHDGRTLKHCPNKATVTATVPPFPWETFMCDEHSPKEVEA